MGTEPALRSDEVGEQGSIDVLHLDDDTSFTELSKQYLEQQDDIVVRTATSVDEAMEHVTDADVDCIVSDYALPDRDGIEFLSEVREIAPELPFILFTGKGSEEIAVDAINEGVTGYIRKGGGDDTFAVLSNRISNAVRSREAERRAQQVRDYYQTLIERSPGIIAVVDDEREFLYRSPSTEHELGYSPSEMIGETPFDYIHPDDQALVAEHLGSVIDGDRKTSEAYEYRFEVAEGTWNWFESVVRDLSDTVVGGYVVHSKEITERKVQEQELRRERERFEKVLETSPVGITLLDADGRIERGNERAEEVLELTSSEMTDRDFDDAAWEIVDEAGDPIPSGDLPFARVRETGEPIYGFEHGVRTSAGTKRWLSINAAPLTTSDGEVERVVAVISETTERKRLERDLRTERDHFRLALENSPVTAFRLDTDLRYTWVGNAHEDFDPDAVIGKRDDELLPEDAAEALMEPKRRALETGEGVREEVTYELPSGTVTYDLSVEPLRDEEGDVVGITCAAVDITEKRARKQALEESEARYRAIAETTPDAIITIDADSRILFANSAVESVFGYTPEQLEGEPLTRLLPERMRDQHREAFERYVETGEQQMDWEAIEFPGLRKDGTEIDLSLSFAAYEEDGDRRVTSIIRDISDRKQLERELQENERRYRTLVEMSPEPILVHVDGEIVYANRSMADLVDAPYAEDLIGTPLERFVDTDVHSDLEQVVKQTQQGEFEPTNRPYIVVTLEQDERYVETTSRPIAYENEPAVLTIAKDVTERHEYEQTLHTLHERTQEMVRAEDREAILRTAVEATDELLDLDGTVIYEFDGGTELTPLVASERVADASVELPSAVKGAGFLWDVFADGEDRFIEDHQSDETFPHPLQLHSVFALPIGNHGVLVTGTTSQHSLSATEREIGQLLRENLEAALDSAERERRLRERDRELEQQNERLKQLNRLNQIIRETTQTLIQSPSRTDVESRICEAFASAPEYSFAWFGTQNEATGQLRLTERAEMDPEYADYLGSEGSHTPLHDLVATAHRDGTVQVARNILADTAWETHRRDVLNQEYRSVAVVPIIQTDVIDSVLVIHGASAELFDERERAVLEELGSTIGHAIQNADRVDTLDTSDHTEIEVRIGDDRLFLNRIASELGVDIEFVGGIPGDGETLRSFLRCTNLPEDGIETELRSFEIVSDVQSLSVEDGVGLYQVTITPPRFLRILQGNDVQLRALTAEGGQSTATIVLTGTLSVRSLVDELQAIYSETELLTRSEDPNPIDTRETFRARLLDELTEKQLDALQTALYGGFYEWPRTSTSEELAETRDIAGSTFQHHLRAAERKLVSAVLDPV